jgi:hypothetical protein
MSSMTREQAVEHNRILHEGLMRIGMCADDEILSDMAGQEMADKLVAHTLKIREENKS